VHRTEKLVFLFGIGAFAFLMLSFGAPLEPSVYLPVVALWIVGGVAYVFWLDRRMRRAENVTPLSRRRKRKR